LIVRKTKTVLVLVSVAWLSASSCTSAPRRFGDAGAPDSGPDEVMPEWRLACATRAGGEENAIDDALGREGGRKVSVLDDGSIYLVGSAAEAAVFGEGEPNETQFGAVGFWSDGFLARYAPGCALDWVRQIGGNDEDHAFSVAALEDGSAVVVGIFRSEQIVFGEGEPNETTLTCALQENDSDCAALAKYDTEGHLVWVRDLGVLKSLQWHVAASTDASILLAGHFYADPTDPDLSDAGIELGEDEAGVLVAKFSAEDGSLEWARLGTAGLHVYNGPQVATISLPEGGILALISFGPELDFKGDDEGQQILESDGFEDIALVRLSAQGEILWMYRLGDEGEDEVFGGGQLEGESFWLTGGYLSDPFVATSGHDDDIPLPLSGSSDVFLMRFDATTPPTE
jgi:hypothetical protein